MPRVIESLITGYLLNYQIERKAREAFNQQINKQKEKSVVERAVDDYKRKNK
jgi:hypothetical protein